MSNSLFDLTGRVALVTGAAQNMGRSSALALAELGADLLVADINGPGVEETAELHPPDGPPRALAFTCDLAEEEQIRAMYRRVDQEFGRIDVALISPAATCWATPRRSPSSTS